MTRRVQPRLDLILQLQPVAQRLRVDTKALRTNIRIQTTSDHNIPVLAEALADGAFSLAGGMSMLGYQGADIHDAPTVRLMRTTGATIVQRDTRVDEPRVPHAREFGGQAGQMLAPLHYLGQFCGFIAVHGDGEPRDWSDDDQKFLGEAVVELEEVLKGAVWFDRPDPTPMKHLLLILSDSEGESDGEHRPWYAADYLTESLKAPGWTFGRPFVLGQSQPSGHLPSQSHLTLCEVSTADPGEALATLEARIAEIAPSGSMAPSDIVALFTPTSERIEP
jgi:hypothetical protein